ncbi:MAG: nitrous oxide reductase family maturation protein NosD [Candidatus Lokiarchaeia archaeon]
MKKGKKITIPIIACLLLLAAAIPLAVALGPTETQQQPFILALSLQSQSPPQPPPKQYTPVTWINPTISNVNVSQDLNITLNGDLNVTETGELHLIHCILNVNNGTTPIEYGVSVYGGMFINEFSTITAINPSNPYFFKVFEGAVFQLNDSWVEYCGHSSGSWPDEQGLAIRADNAWIENNTLTLGRSGLILYGSQGSTILNNNATDNLGAYGIRLDNSWHNNLTGNRAINNWQGIRLINSSYNNLSGNTATDSGVEGFALSDSSYNNLSGNTATNYNAWAGFYLYHGSNNNLTGNTATNNNPGFYLYASTDNTLSGNTATNNNNAFYLYYTSLRNNLSGNTATNNNNGFYLGSSSDLNTLTGNIAANNTYYGFQIYSSSNNNLTGNVAINCATGYAWSGVSSNNDFTGSVVANWLRVNVTDVLGLPISSAHVKVENVTVVYATSYFSGSDPTTGSNGLTPWFAVPYKTFTGPVTMTDNSTTITVWYSTLWSVANFSDNSRTVSMSMSHVENFTVVSWQSTPLKTMAPMLLLFAMPSGVSPIVYAALGIAAVIGVAATALLYYFRRLRV